MYTDDLLSASRASGGFAKNEVVQEQIDAGTAAGFVGAEEKWAVFAHGSRSPTDTWNCPVR
jgi:hypothetical protein